MKMIKEFINFLSRLSHNKTPQIKIDSNKSGNSVKSVRKLKPKGKIWVIADTHFGHRNIIRYCHRPFGNVYDMNETLVRNWNLKVEKDDTVYFLGDFVTRGSIGLKITQLHGNKIFIRGNHDGKLKHTIHHKNLNYKGYSFLFVHNPAHIPKYWNGWAIYGHKHNNNLSRYPFIDGMRKRINVGVELINYQPISLDYLISLNLDSISRMDTINSRVIYK